MQSQEIDLKEELRRAKNFMRNRGDS